MHDISTCGNSAKVNMCVKEKPVIKFTVDSIIHPFLHGVVAAR